MRSSAWKPRTRLHVAAMLASIMTMNLLSYCDESRELSSRVARRGWTAPDNFGEAIAIYADDSALAAMLQDVWRVDTLEDLLALHSVQLPGMTPG